LAASADAPVYVWDTWAGLPPPRKLTGADLQRAWSDLAGDDAKAAFAGIRRLSTAPDQAVPFLRERLQPVPAPDAVHVRRLLADLDNAQFAVRQKATTELDKFADAAGALLEEAKAKAGSEESRQRLDKILTRRDALTSESLRLLRAVEAVEWAACPEAMHLLEDWAKGAAGARLTREAALARDRLSKAAPSR